MIKKYNDNKGSTLTASPSSGDGGTTFSVLPLLSMKILVACEESQTVCKAFRGKGHEAFSCDIQDCSGGHPEWHYKCDVRELINEYFDLVIFHPDCTFITNTGVSWLYKKEGRWAKLEQAILFFNLRHQFNSPKVATENPIPHKYAVDGVGIGCGIGKYDQLIQPYQFGHLERKATCLWLKGLEPLKETNNVYEEMKALPKNVSQRIHYLPPGPERAKLRSKTYQGIADAMADQWSN